MHLSTWRVAGDGRGVGEKRFINFGTFGVIALSAALLVGVECAAVQPPVGGAAFSAGGSWASSWRLAGGGVGDAVTQSRKLRRHENENGQTVTTAAAVESSWWRSRIIGTGSAVPDAVISNFDLEKIVNTSDAWIMQRTGIARRRVLLPYQSLQRLASDAALRAIESARISPEDIDAVVVASSTPEDLFGDATSIAGLIGAKRAVCWDIRAACSGFLFALINAAQFIQTGTYRTMLVIGSDALSRWVDWTDRNTCILFGDGAGAVVLQAVDSAAKSGLLAFTMGSDPTGHDHLQLPRSCTAAAAVGRRTGAVQHPMKLKTESGNEVRLEQEVYDFVSMNGREVYRFVLNEIPRAIDEVLSRAGVTIAEVDWLLLHQANTRIIGAVAGRLGLPMSKVLTNIEEYGNTSAASIPLALDEAVRRGMLKDGDLIVTGAFGAGLSWSVALLRWTADHQWVLAA